MNRQITHLFGLFVVLLAVLVAFTSRWAVLEAEGLEDMTANRRPLLEEQRTPRGLIMARDGRLLAQSRGLGQGETRRFFRTYPEGPLFSHVVGYSFIDRGRSGIEKSWNRELAGDQDEFASVIDSLTGRGREGRDVRLTLDPAAQRAAVEALGGQRGSIVAIEPATGAIRTMVSIPDFDPNQVPRQFSMLNRASGSPLFNRATQARYPPGSTFKVVTAAAAIDSGRYTPNSVVSGQNGKPISGVPLQNSGGADFGSVSLTQGLTKSVNTVWGEVGETLGKETMFDYMGRFGFGRRPPIGYPAEQLSPSGVFDGSRILGAGDNVDMGRVAIGQERLQVTPLQMAMVAAAVGNGGALMRPRLVERVQSREGRVTRRVRPERLRRVISRESAQQVGAMMSQVVQEGTGTSAALSGISVAGKTGTAEVESGATNQAWFIAFAPLDNPQMAIAVTVERTSGQGGTVAAPIAKRVLQVLLGR